MRDFSLTTELLERILTDAKPLGHHEEPATLNLGFGFLYYGLVRAVRPRHVLVIGSGYGFSVVCLALGFKDNGSGVLSFLDPSYFFDHLSGANVFNIFQSIGSAGGLYTLLAPYFVAFSVFSGQSRLTHEALEHFGSQSAALAEAVKVAHFTDTFYEINGVSRTLQQQLEVALETGAIVTALDSKALLEALRSLTADPRRLADMGRAARAYMQERSFERAFQCTWQMYRAAEGAPWAQAV